VPTEGLLTAADVRALGQELGLRPTKTLGQNFVIDPNTVRRLVRTAGVDAGDVVVGGRPGLGSLTLGLLEVASRVVGVEIDPVLAGRLPQTVADRLPACADRLEVVLQDALDLDSCPGRRRPPSWRTCRTTSRCRSCSACSSTCRPCGPAW
jgi:16S rRNA (adenine1518-N6/adenine1519-N6)-dimethyltransferase